MQTLIRRIVDIVVVALALGWTGLWLAIAKQAETKATAFGHAVPQDDHEIILLALALGPMMIIGYYFLRRAEK